MTSTQAIGLATACNPLPKKRKLDVTSLQVIKIPNHNGQIYTFENIQDVITLIKGLLKEGEITKLLLAYDTKNLDQTNLYSLIKKANGEIYQITLKDEVIARLDEIYKDEGSFFIVNDDGSLIIIAASFFEEPHCSAIMGEKVQFPAYVL